MRCSKEGTRSLPRLLAGADARASGYSLLCTESPQVALFCSFRCSSPRIRVWHPSEIDADPKSWGATAWPGTWLPCGRKPIDEGWESRLTSDLSWYVCRWLHAFVRHIQRGAGQGRMRLDKGNRARFHPYATSARVLALDRAVGTASYGTGGKRWGTSMPRCDCWTLPST